MTADLLTTLGTAMGSAWLSGINLYATVVTLGVLQRFELVKLPGGLNVLGEWWDGARWRLLVGLVAAYREPHTPLVSAVMHEARLLAAQLQSFR